jgi:ribosomal protein S12 methylthiotransferase accessory factor
MISRPRIKSKYHVETIPGDGIFLLSENERHVLEGESLMQLVPLLDGNHTWDELLGY